MKKWILGSVFAIISSIGMPLVSWAGGPTTTVQRLVESVRTFKPESASLSAQERSANSKAQKVSEETIAIADLAKRVLGPQWSKLSATEQKDFTQLLAQLLQKIAYPKSAEFFGELKVDYTGEKLNGSGALVETTVSHPKEGQVSIDYELRQVNGKWMIDDVLLDSVSLVTNVQSQIQQVINKESYQGLLKRMREKLAENS
jgi:phospholipid transport system substrate-binding protein